MWGFRTLKINFQLRSWRSLELLESDKNSDVVSISCTWEEPPLLANHYTHYWGLKGAWMVLHGILLLIFLPTLTVVFTTVGDGESTLSKFNYSFPPSPSLSQPWVVAATVNHGGTRGLCVVVVGRRLGVWWESG